ncbi:MAG: MBL fold metallo-hydrolase [Firmicutes bacterium]|nr:MBL fold metallo-hydrolase [Bacillota bacterium]
MKLTVLGNNGPYPKAGSACSGYLIEYKNTKILLDCGNGVLSRLFKFTKLKNLDAIILSHLHSDHISDILIMKYAIGLKNDDEKTKFTLPIFCPTDDNAFLEKMNYNNAFKINSIDDSKNLIINDLEISFKKMIHPVTTYAVKIKSDNKILVYSGDTSYNNDIIEFAKNSDLFLCEAGTLEKDRSDDTPHLSAKQAGKLATEANVKRLVLTHFWPEYRLDKIMKEASLTYDSILELSHEMKSYFI